MLLRPYQREAVDAVNAYLASGDGHGVVSIPTAGGKTIVFATMIKEWLTAWPESRICILAHRQELLAQAEEKLRRVWPAAPTGVWSAGLGRREADCGVLIAGIQSVYRRACKFDPFDVIIVDEAHLVPNKSDTMYRRFLADAKLCNPAVRYIGYTATPFRLDGGDLCGEGKLFTDICYEANIKALIANKFLCALRTKATQTQLDTTGVHTKQGDFVQSELEAKVNTDDVVSAAVAEIVAKGADRKAWLVFCCGIAHAHHVSSKLAKHGVIAPVVIGTTSKEDRARILQDFDTGRLRAVVNVNCLTTGLDVTRIDMIAVLRPTQSTSLWVQMVGRGFRLHEGKQDCLVLDFGGNSRRHGPLDDLHIKTPGEGGKAPVKECPQCHELVALKATECPDCGHEFEITTSDPHSRQADDMPLISTEPWHVEIDEVSVVRHQKEGKPALLRVNYHGTNYMEQHAEWICLEHTGYARAKAYSWWKRRFGEPVPKTVDEALKHSMFLASQLTEMTESIRVQRDGKYTRVVGATLRHEAANDRVGAIAR